MERLWRIELLGGVGALSHDRKVDRFRTHKTAALLAYLAYYPQRSHLREELVELLWPDDELDSARMKLRLALSSLRRQLEDPRFPGTSVLLSDRLRVRLNPAAFDTDVAEFQSLIDQSHQAGTSRKLALLSRATSLYRGELLPGHEEEWIAGERARLETTYTRAVKTQATLMVECGDPEAAARGLYEVVRLNPYGEGPRRALIELYASTGRPEAALQVLGEYESLLREELGRTLSPALRALRSSMEALIRSGSPLTELAPPAPPSDRNFSPTGALTVLVLSAGSGELEAANKAVHGAAVLGEGYGRTVREFGGRVIRLTGDYGVAAFGRTRAAAACAVSLQQGRGDGPAPELRCALHLVSESEGPGFPDTADALLRQLLDVAYAGQIVCSEEIALLLRRDERAQWPIEELGRYRLGAGAGERLFQIRYPGMGESFPAPKAVRLYQSRLPLISTRFIGREAELARLAELLPPVPALSPSAVARLVTLTGPGGSGKTRLALEAAARTSAAFPGAVWVAFLADLPHAGDMVTALLESQGLRPAPGVDRWEFLCEALSHAPALLLLDNFDPLVEEGAPLVARLLERVPALRCLVTSRRVLDLSGEVELPVRPLEVPVGAPDPAALARCPSVQLFVDRAQAVRADFQCTPASAAALGELCRRLEGIPLAIELAAARARVLSPAQMLEALEQRLDFLAGSRRDLPARHRTLRSALEWSYQALSPELQRSFARLSVFRGGWSFAAAGCLLEQTSSISTLERLTQLRDHSLIWVEEMGGEARYRMLETLREYGAEQLEVDEREVTAQRHARYFLDFAAARLRRLRTDGEADALAELRREWDNVRAALAWAQAAAAAKEELRPLFTGLALAAGQYLQRQGALGDALQIIQAGIQVARGQASPDAARLGALLREAASISIDSLDWSAAGAAAGEALRLAGETGDSAREAGALNLLGLAAYGARDFDTARQRLAAALALHERDGSYVGAAMACNNLGTVEEQDPAGSKEKAVGFLNMALDRFRSAGYRRGEAETLTNLGMLAQAQGSLGDARGFYQEALWIDSRQNETFGSARALANLGEVAGLEGRWSAAYRLLLAADLLFRRVGSAYREYTTPLLQEAAAHAGLRGTLLRDCEALRDRPLSDLIDWALPGENPA